MRLLSTLILVLCLGACRSLPPDVLPGTSPEARDASAWLADRLGVDGVEVRDALLLEAGLFGATYRLPDGTFVILLDPRLTETERTMVLIHEWAHVLAWDDEDMGHGPEWGLAYSLVFRTWIGELDSPPESGYDGSCIYTPCQTRHPPPTAG